MNNILRVLKLIKVGAAAFVLTLAAGCESSGGEGGGDAAGSGTVSVLMTDAPTRDFLSFKVTVSRIDLLRSDGSQVALKTDESEFDLLRLENLSQLFAHTPDIPAGTYRKIRLTIKRIELEDRRTRNSIFPLVRSEFKLDLLPREPFVVTADSRLVIEIDIDARKSVRWRGGRFRFRPVVFVKVGVEQVSHLIEVKGVVNNIDLTAGSFEICRVDYSDAGVNVTDECMTAALSADSSIFNPDGMQGSINDLVATEIVKVVGHFDPANDARIDVEVVERDALAAFVTLYGTVLSAPDGGTMFEVTLDSDQDATADPVVGVALQAGTRVFDASGAELDATSIVAGRVVEASGVLAVSQADPDTLWSELVIVKENAPVELDLLNGFVLSRDGNNVTLFTTDSGNHCVRVLDGADVQVVTEGSAGSNSAPGTLADLHLGREIDLYGSAAGDGCFEAQSVVVFVIAD